jgi:hypothetical protein
VKLIAQQGYIIILWILNVQPDELVFALDYIADVLRINFAPEVTIGTANNELAIS